jgi:cation-transporting ATPase 13A3/4/5
VFHPFYVFQIASLILWTLDDYYIYATAIFVISALSITTSLVETKLVGPGMVAKVGVHG